MSTIVHKNNETNDKCYGIVAFLMYKEMINFRPQSIKAAPKQKATPRNWALGCHPSDSGHVTH